MNTGTSDYAERRNREDERRIDKGLYHTADTFNKMLQESNAKLKNVNDKFMDAMKAPKKDYCWSCEKEIKDINKTILIAQHGTDDQEYYPLCDECADKQEADYENHKNND